MALGRFRKTGPTPPREYERSLRSEWISPQGVTEVTKARTLIVILLFLVWNRDYVNKWIHSIKRFEFAGITVDLQTVDSAVQKIREKADTVFSTQDVQEAKALGIQLLLALDGARVLWVDPHPLDNTAEQDFLEAYHIVFDRVSNSEDGKELFMRRHYDLLITSSLHDEKVASPPLKSCPVVYAQIPANGRISTYKGTSGTSELLEQYNKEANAMPIAGFAMIEAIHTRSPDVPIIMYSASNGGVSSTSCAITTNYVNVFLRSVFLSLAHSRWQSLAKAQSQD
jgi:hypothetical protein